MKLQNYLDALKNCPDEEVRTQDSCEQKVHRLTADFGVYDNFPIFLRTDFSGLIEYLNSSRKYELSGSDNKTKYNFDYIPGTVRLQVSNQVYSLCCFGTEEEKQMQRKNYNTTVILHPYQKKKMPFVSDERAIAVVVDDIAQLIQREHIPSCFPQSIGWNNLNDYSQIVYFPDEVEIEMCKSQGAKQ